MRELCFYYYNVGNARRGGIVGETSEGGTIIWGNNIVPLTM